MDGRQKVKLERSDNEEVERGKKRINWKEITIYGIIPLYHTKLPYMVL